MAKWLRQRFAKPLFPSSNLGGASIEKSAASMADEFSTRRSRARLRTGSSYRKTSDIFPRGKIGASI